MANDTIASRSGASLLSAATAFVLASMGAFASPSSSAAEDVGDAEADRARKIVLIAGPITGHGKQTHEYEKSVILLKHLLDTSPSFARERSGSTAIATEVHFRGWPDDPTTLDDADTIVFITDGGDRRAEDHPLYVGERLAQLERQMKRGCGLVMLHWSTFHPAREHERITEWLGGYFDYETGPEPRRWYSAIQTWEGETSLGTQEHPITRGVKPFRVQEEFYYRMRFRENDTRLRPILKTRPPGEPDDHTVAWAVERSDGGRSFGFTGGHFYRNWWLDDFRRLALNAIVWSAGVDVPAGGIESELDEPLRALVVTGHQHPAHDWRATTAALIQVIEQDPRVFVDVTERIEDLAAESIRDYDLLVMNYCNWDRPGLTDAAKENFVRYLKDGGGLAVIHFANGAFTDTLPNKESDWPEYRTRIVRRIWVHGDGKSGHDAFGPFRVDIAERPHPITAGLRPFQTIDELYFRQMGELPIEPLATARSQVTGDEEPMAWAYEYGKGRVFQTVLGHADQSIRLAGSLVRRGSVWAARGEPLSFDPPVELTTQYLWRAGSQWTPDESKKREDAAKTNGGAAKSSSGSPNAPKGIPGANPDEKPRPLKFAEGRFGRAIDARAGGAVFAGGESMQAPPLTVECWTRLHGKTGFNILVAGEVKASSMHWELYSYAASGVFSVYMPGMKPAEIRSDVDICDGQWHHVAMQYEPGRVRMFVDGRQVKDQTIESIGGSPVRGGLAIGTLVERTIGCDGLIDDVRITRGIRPIERSPDKPHTRDDMTLIHLPCDDEKEFADRIARVDPASASGQVAAVSPDSRSAKIEGHWGEDAVGFRWTEDDSVDGRWQAMDTGPFFSSSLLTPGQPTRKGISIRVGNAGRRDSDKDDGAKHDGAKHDVAKTRHNADSSDDASGGSSARKNAPAAVCFDTERLAYSAAWTGGFLKLDPARYGLIRHPAIDGPIAFASHGRPGIAWVDAGRDRPARYEGLYLHGERIVLQYRIGDEARVRESPWFHTLGSDRLPVFTRTIEAGPRDGPLRLLALASPSAPTIRTLDGVRLLCTDIADQTIAVGFVGGDGVVGFGATNAAQDQTEKRDDEAVSGGKIGGRKIDGRKMDGRKMGGGEMGGGEMGGGKAAEETAHDVTVEILPSKAATVFTLHVWRGPVDRLSEFAGWLRSASGKSPESIDALAQPGEPIWGGSFVTRGELGDSDSGPYAVDTLTIPFDNPHRALMFVGGHDFFSNGDAAVCTVHGDVWLVRGIDETLGELRWKRFATGLFHPLGLRIVDDRVHVLGRDQITRLADRNGDDEADWYENFNNDGDTSLGNHDYAACLETDSAGDFFYVRGNTGVHRVSADGTQHELFADGLRNPNGLGIGPGDILTTSPQEGEWTPASSILEVRRGGYYGYGGPRASADRPLGYDPPLLWLPRRVDNSSGGQVWGTDPRFGPLADRMLHLSYGQSTAMAVLRDEVDGVAQAAAYTLPLSFDSGVMRGRVHPRDGQVYVSGMRGWVSNAARDGCFQRIRYTGRPACLPIAASVHSNGVRIEFSAPLDPDWGTDVGNFAVERWNYRWSAEYGSPEISVSRPESQGRDEVEVVSASLGDNGRSLILELSDMRPVMQMSVAMRLRGVDGTRVRRTLYWTIHRLNESLAIDPAARNKTSPFRLTDDQRQRLRPGWVQTFRAIGSDVDRNAAPTEDRRTSRTAAMFVPAGSPPTPFLPAGSFRMTWSGLVHIPIGGEYSFYLAGRGIEEGDDDAAVTIDGRPIPADESAPPLPLAGGYHAIEVQYASPASGDAALRVEWSGEDFAREPLSPTQLGHFADLRESTVRGDATQHGETGNNDVASDSIMRASAAADLRRNGRELFVERLCHRCHAPRDDRGRAIIDERLDREGPSFVGIGGRLNEAWIRAWLVDPKALRPQARMPHVLFGDDSTRRQTAADIAAFLSDQFARVDGDGTENSAEEADADTTDDGHDDRILAGEILFEDLGCIACHTLAAPREKDEWNRLTLHFTGVKFRPGELARFLRQPQRHYSATRMGDFDLLDDEAAALAAFITARGAAESPSGGDSGQGGITRGDSRRGAVRFRSFRCAACHPTTEVDSANQTETRDSAATPPNTEMQFTPSSVSWSRLAESIDSPRSCTSAARRSSDDEALRPHYKLAADEHAALRVFVGTDGAALGRFVVAEAAERLVVELNCTACHARDHRSSDFPEILDEETSQGFPPEILPSITWVGDKLHADWTWRLLSGEIRSRTRPWLKARMPRFPAHASSLAAGLAHQHGWSAEREPQVARKPASDVVEASRIDLVEAGRRLTTKTGGLDCRQCHGLGPLPPDGDQRTRLALGTNFVIMHDRLRREFYDRWMLDPLRIDPQTKMPKFSPDGLRTPVRDLLDGDARRQFDAIWRYVESLEQ